MPAAGAAMDHGADRMRMLAPVALPWQDTPWVRQSDLAFGRFRHNPADHPRYRRDGAVRGQWNDRGRKQPVPEYPCLTLRVIVGPDVLLGAGKADLLEGIAETGSIAAAGRRMGMSYKRAWYLIDTLNSYFHEPVVMSAKGGRAGGGAALTDTGRTVLDLFRRIQRNAETAAADEMRALAAMAAAGRPNKT